MMIWICKQHAECSDCDIVYDSESNNEARAQMIKHCKKTGHHASVSMLQGINGE